MDLLKNDARVVFILALLSSLVLFNQINWLHYFILFWIIDVFGYWPGFLFTKFFARDTPPPIFYYLYNLFHSFSGVFVICITYLFFFDTPLTLLAVALHISIDRGLLGNSLKSSEEVFT